MTKLVIVAHRDAIQEAKIRKFLTALQAGVGYLRAHPQKSWEAFAAAHPELRTELNHRGVVANRAPVRHRSGSA